MITRLESLFLERYGLVSIRQHRKELWHWSRAGAHRAGARDVSTFIATMCSGEPWIADEAIDQLATTLLNGTTAFFRESESTAVLLAALREQRRSDGLASRPLQIWCAGVASGEEAYSTAMLLVEHGLSGAVVGSDLGRQALDRATLGRYSARELKNVNPRRIARHFERDGDHFTINPDIRAMCRFQHHNLLKSPLRPQCGSGGWDIVLLRNVLIHLEAGAQTKVVESLASSLAPHGLLMLGAAESLSLTRAATLGLEPQWLGALVYARVKAKQATEYGAGGKGTPGRDEAHDIDETSDTNRANNTGPEVEAISLAKTSTARSASRARADGDAMLDRGEHTEALNCYDVALEQEPLAFDLHLRRGMTYLAMRHIDEAESALRRTLFLAPLCWQAAFLLADIATLPAARRAAYWRIALDGMEAASLGSGTATYLGPFDVAIAVAQVTASRQLASLSIVKASAPID